MVLAAKDIDHARATGADVLARQALLVGEVARPWFHSPIALAHCRLPPADVLAEPQSGAQAPAASRRRSGARPAREPGGAMPPSRRTTWLTSSTCHRQTAKKAQAPQDRGMGQLHPAPDRRCGGPGSGAQAGALLLVVALVIDLVKKDEAAGTWQASHFSRRIRSVIIAGLLYIVTCRCSCCCCRDEAWFGVSIWFLTGSGHVDEQQPTRRPLGPMAHDLNCLF